MATLDLERGLVVVRIVYDGPARAGKTTSLAALGTSLGREVVCAGEPEGERDGRTLWFDWMDYVGGLFDGRLIRCQAVTVPGQAELWPRRRALLESADVVVFVADSARGRLDADLEALDGLRRVLRGRDEPAPAAILQLNKRDLADAVPLDEIRARLARPRDGAGEEAGGGPGDPVAVTETVAHEGVGIRETFILAVRLALDRVRELVRRGDLAEGRPDVDSAEELLAALSAALPAAEPRAEISAEVTNEPAAAAEAVTEDAPRPPDAAVPGGMIWPPVGGRLILHESAPDASRLRRLAAGGWADFGNPFWLIHSPGGYRFGNLEEGRHHLIEWARWHALLGPHLSPRRCVVLGESGPESWRLWQIVGRQATLGALLGDAFAAREPERIADRLAVAAEALAGFHARPELRRLRPGLETVGFDAGRPVYLGLLPPLPRGHDHAEALAELFDGADREEGDEAPYLHELAALIDDELARWPEGRAPLLSALARLGGRSAPAAALERLAGPSRRPPAPAARRGRSAPSPARPEPRPAD